MDEKKKQEALKQWLDALRDSGKAIVVEGQKDFFALTQLGIAPLFTLSRKPLFAIAEEVAFHHRDVIILTDFDRQGRHWYARLKQEFQRQGVRVDHFFREELFCLTEISHIEELKRYAE